MARTKKKKVVFWASVRYLKLLDRVAKVEFIDDDGKGFFIESEKRGTLLYVKKENESKKRT